MYKYLHTSSLLRAEVHESAPRFAGFAEIYDLKKEAPADLPRDFLARVMCLEIKNRFEAKQSRAR